MKLAKDKRRSGKGSYWTLAESALDMFEPGNYRYLCFSIHFMAISYFGSISNAPICELYVLDLNPTVFCRKKNQLHFPMDIGQGTHSGKLVLIAWPKISQMHQKNSAQFDCPSPTVSKFWKKKHSLSVHSPWLKRFHETIYNLSYLSAKGFLHAFDDFPLLRNELFECSNKSKVRNA